MQKIVIGGGFAEDTSLGRCRPRLPTAFTDKIDSFVRETPQDGSIEDTMFSAYPVHQWTIQHIVSSLSFTCSFE